MHLCLVISCFRCERTLYPDDLNDFVRKTESVTTSSNHSKGEGLDTRLEEVNKASKAWAVGAMTATEWLRIFRNHDSLLQVCLSSIKSIGRIEGTMGTILRTVFN